MRSDFWLYKQCSIYLETKYSGGRSCQRLGGFILFVPYYGANHINNGSDSLTCLLLLFKEKSEHA